MNRTRHRSILVVLSVIFFAVIGLSIISVPVSASLTAWLQTTNFASPAVAPSGMNIDYQSCVAGEGYTYCVGGYNNTAAHPLVAASNAVYYAPFYPSGGIVTGCVGVCPGWQSTTPYPTVITSQSCVLGGSYIYCVGGYATSSPTDAVYYAPVSSSGVGAWTATTSYPTIIYDQSCVVSGNYIFCVGGHASATQVVTKAVYYAPLTSSGVGSWKSGTSYPTIIAQQSCVSSGGEIYCVGGYDTNTGTVTDAVCFASLGTSVSPNVGPWTCPHTETYPQYVFSQSCVASGDYTTQAIYCVGGETGSGSGLNSVYAASLSQSPVAVGTWTSTASYPLGLFDQSCVDSQGYIYCIGGYVPSLSDITSAVYFI